MGQWCHRQRSKTRLTLITSSTIHSNRQHKAPLPPWRKIQLIQEGTQPQGDWLQKQGCYVLPQSQATQILTDIHQALHIGTKPLYHLLRPLITYPNLPSLLQQITHSCIICSSVSPQGAPKAYSVILNTAGSRTYPRRGLANWLHSHASNIKNKTRVLSSRHFFRVDWGFSYEIRNYLRGNTVSHMRNYPSLWPPTLSPIQ